MSSELSEALSELLARPAVDPSVAVRESTPRGWEPVIEQSADEVAATTQSREVESDLEPNEDELLRWVDLDPNIWAIASVRRSKWQTYDERWLEAYKINAVRKAAKGVDIEELVRIRDSIAMTGDIKPARTGSDGVFVVVLADWQFGKGEAGGPEATVNRIKEAVCGAVARLHDLESTGVRPSRVVLVGLGDLVEGCSGWYSMQSWQVQLTRREQTNVARRLIIWIVKQFADCGYPITLATVAGNHGENRKDGKAFTTFGDNDDIAVFEQVADIVSESASKFGNINFVIPGDDLTITMELDGIRVAAAHGHQFRSGATAAAKAFNWWKGQALGDQGCGAAQILLSGHFHHLSVVTFGSRTHIQAPSMDGDSQWFRETAGCSSPPGMVTLMIGQGQGPLGWDHLQVV